MSCLIDGPSILIRGFLAARFDVPFRSGFCCGMPSNMNCNERENLGEETKFLMKLYVLILKFIGFLFIFLFRVLRSLFALRIKFRSN